MTNTKAKWFRNPGSKPVYEPQRPPRERSAPIPDERRRYPTPRDPSPPFDPNRRPETEPGFDPRFKPKPARPVVPKPSVRFPTPRVPRLPGGWGAVPGVIEFVDPANWFPKQEPLPPGVRSGGWKRKAGPFTYPPLIPGWEYNDPKLVQSSLTSWEPIEFQSVGHQTVIPAWQWWLGVWWCYTSTTGSNVHRHDNHSYWERAQVWLPADIVVDPTFPGSNGAPAAPVEWFGNPNNDRWSPGAAPPDLVPGTAVPLSEPSPEAFANPATPYVPDRQWQWEYGIGTYSRPGTDTGSGVTNPPGQTPPVPGTVRLPPVQRQPPERNEKQRKVLTKSAKLGIALFKVLDGLSESGEVVDALYDALPDDVKRRWNRLDRVGDNFGQYGLGGADWKLQALYHNWHKVDVEQAVKNIFKNELQDRIIGGMQAGLPNNTGQAHSQGEKRLAELLDEWFAQEFGL